MKTYNKERMEKTTKILDRAKYYQRAIQIIKNYFFDDLDDLTFVTFDY